jgi:hypothetical protein
VSVSCHDHGYGVCYDRHRSYRYNSSHYRCDYLGRGYFKGGGYGIHTHVH